MERVTQGYEKTESKDFIMVVTITNKPIVKHI